MILKLADLSYNFRPYELSKKWTERVYEEYFDQVIFLILGGFRIQKQHAHKLLM